MRKLAISVIAGVILLGIAIPKTTEAVTVPTPGWVSISNNLVQNGTGCEGGVAVSYALRTVDVAHGVRISLNQSDCSITALNIVWDHTVTIGTTGEVETTAQEYLGFGEYVSADHVESLGSVCTAVKGDSGTSGTEEFPVYTPTSAPPSYGSGCSSGFYEAWNWCPGGNSNACKARFQLDAGLDGFGIPHCNNHLWWFADNSYDENFGGYDCLWSDDNTATYSVGTEIIHKLTPNYTQTVQLF